MISMPVHARNRLLLRSMLLSDWASGPRKAISVTLVSVKSLDLRYMENPPCSCVTPIEAVSEMFRDSTLRKLIETRRTSGMLAKSRFGFF